MPNCRVISTCSRRPWDLLSTCYRQKTISPVFAPDNRSRRTLGRACGPGPTRGPRIFPQLFPELSLSFPQERTKRVFPQRGDFPAARTKNSRVDEQKFPQEFPQNPTAPPKKRIPANIPAAAPIRSHATRRRGGPRGPAPYPPRPAASRDSRSYNAAPGSPCGGAPTGRSDSPTRAGCAARSGRA